MTTEEKITLLNVQEEGIQKAKTAICAIYEIWNKLGLQEDQQISRCKNAWNHVVSLLNDIATEENGIYENVKERIQNYSTKIVELSKVLSIEPKEIGGSLIEKEILMRHELDSLIKLKSNRVRTYQDLKNSMLNCCRILNFQTDEMKITSEIPSEKDIEDIRKKVTNLEVERKKRLAKLSAAKKQLSTILEATELPPETILEQEILSGKDNFSLSEDILAEIEEVVLNASRRKSHLESQKKELIEKLSGLWKNLNTEEKDKVAFLSNHLDCRVSTIDSIRKEIEKCEQLKKANLQNIILNLRSELEDLWSKCYISENQKDLFPIPTEFTEEVFEEHEKQIQKWKKYHEEVQHILVKIVKRQELFDKLKVFELKASDPNRFKNRKYNLIQEEQERKELQKDLPKFELAVMKDIQDYETKTGQLFLYFGGDYKTYLDNQWTNWRNEKEKEKLKKEKHELLQLKNEITPNSTRKRRLASVTQSAPGKLFKGSQRNLISCTPASKQCSPNAINRQRQFQSLKKHTLRERNRAPPVQSEAKSPLEETTYELFVGQLNFAVENQLESTAISGKKTKFRKRQQQKLKTVKELRRSPRNRVSFKSSPMRGKFGLPFII